MVLSSAYLSGPLLRGSDRSGTAWHWEFPFVFCLVKFSVPITCARPSDASLTYLLFFSASFLFQLSVAKKTSGGKVKEMWRGAKLMFSYFPSDVSFHVSRQLLERCKRPKESKRKTGFAHSLPQRWGENYWRIMVFSQRLALNVGGESGQQQARPKKWYTRACCWASGGHLQSSFSFFWAFLFPKEKEKK